MLYCTSEIGLKRQGCPKLQTHSAHSRSGGFSKSSSTFVTVMTCESCDSGFLYQSWTGSGFGSGNLWCLTPFFGPLARIDHSVYLPSEIFSGCRTFTISIGASLVFADLSSSTPTCWVMASRYQGTTRTRCCWRRNLHARPEQGAANKFVSRAQKLELLQQQKLKNSNLWLNVKCQKMSKSWPAAGHFLTILIHPNPTCLDESSQDYLRFWAKLTCWFSKNSTFLCLLCASFPLGLQTNPFKWVNKHPQAHVDPTSKNIPKQTSQHLPTSQKHPMLRTTKTACRGGAAFFLASSGPTPRHL